MKKPSGPVVFTEQRGVPHAGKLVFLCGVLAALLLFAIVFS
jgi:hypothetical protein